MQKSLLSIGLTQTCWVVVLLIELDGARTDSVGAEEDVKFVEILVGTI